MDLTIISFKILIIRKAEYKKGDKEQVTILQNELYFTLSYGKFHKNVEQAIKS